jgi:NADPH-dependent 2,4-dienoyl-CoA reductase/sulfur reductase-like enzyme
MSTESTAQVVVIGAGPAGIAAASAAAEHGCKVLLLDDNHAPGGQIWREPTTARYSAQKQRDAKKERALERFQRSGAQLLPGRAVFNATADGLVETMQESAVGSIVEKFRFQKLILATGARERFLPFPGWTLPGVFGAGGLQALVSAGYPIAGKRVVVAGTGPLLLAVAAHLVQDGARVPAVAEQASMARLAPFAASLWRQPAKLLQGAAYRARLRTTAYRTGTWVVQALSAAEGNLLSAVRLTNGNRTWIESCDMLACGYHLVPNTELAEVLGCALADGFVKVDEEQRTSVPNVFCVGEPTSIAGLDAALVQGEIAGITCAGGVVKSQRVVARKERAFAERLERAFVLRKELRALAQPDTIVCRCEDVTLADLQGHAGWSDIKLQTRCGMGPCQGRICGPAVEFLQGWNPSSVRQPIYPVPLCAFGSADGLMQESCNKELSRRRN